MSEVPHNRLRITGFCVQRLKSKRHFFGLFIINRLSRSGSTDTNQIVLETELISISSEFSNIYRDILSVMPSAFDNTSTMSCTTIGRLYKHRWTGNPRRHLISRLCNGHSPETVKVRVISYNKTNYLFSYVENYI